MYLCFATPDTPGFQHLDNRIAATVTRGRFCHVSIVFERLVQTDAFDSEQQGSDAVNPGTRRVLCEYRIVRTGEKDHCDRAELRDGRNWTEFREWTAYRYRPAINVVTVIARLRERPSETYDLRTAVIDFLCCGCFPASWRAVSHDDKACCSSLTMRVLHLLGVYQDQPETLSPNEIARLVEEDSLQWTPIQVCVSPGPRTLVFPLL